MNILITHGYSDSNKGDLAITLATYLFLRDNYPNSKIILHSTFRKSAKDFNYHNRFMSKQNIIINQGILPSPYSSSSKSVFLDLLAVFRLIIEVLQLKISLFFPWLGKIIGGNQYKSLVDFKNTDLVIVKGGQFIYNDKEDLRGNLFLWRTLQPLKIAKKLNKKVIIFGQSFGGFATQKSEKMAIKYLDYCHIIMAREKVSLNFLNKYNLISKSIKIPDLAFYLKKVYLNNNNIYAKLPTNIFGVTVVNWNFPESEDPKVAKTNYINTLFEGIKYAYNTFGLTPVFIPQVTVKHHGESDNDIVNILQKNLKKEGVFNIFLKEDLSTNQMMQIYKNCHFLIGTRLHSCILSANVETPIIAIRYQGYKTQGIMEELDLSNLVLDINTIRLNDLISKMNYVNNNKNNIKKTLKKQTDQFVNQFEKIDFFNI